MNEKRSRIELATPLLAALAAIGAIWPAQALAQCVNPPADLAGWWRAEYDASDAIDGNHGSLENGVTFTTGKVDQAFDFRHSLDRVVIPDSPNISFTNANDYTIEFWMNAGVQTTFASIVEKWERFGPYPFVVRLDPPPYPSAGRIYVGAFDGTIGYIAQSVTRVDDNQWHHIAGVVRHSQNQIEMFVDGVLEASTTYPSLGSIANDHRLFLGIRGTLASNTDYNGLLDELAIYNRALTPTEIAAIHTAGTAGKCPPPPPPCAPLPTGAVSWWRAENDALDFVDGNHGTLQNGATFAAGRVGRAFSFDGSDDYLDVPDSSSLDTTSALTIEAWVKPATAKYHRVITKWGTAGFRTFSVDMNGGSAVFYTSPDGSGYHAIATPAGAVPVAQWTHVACVFQGGSQQAIYINGQLRASSGTWPALFASTAPFRLARNYNDDPGPYWFHGLLDEVTLYSRALSQAEIQSIVAAGSVGKCTNDPPTVTCPMPASVNCSPPSGVELTLSTHVGDADGDGLTVEWRVGDTLVETDTVPAGGPPTDANVSLTYTFVPGTHQIHVTVRDGVSDPVNCGSTVQVNPETEAPMLTCPDDVMAEADENCQAAVPDVTQQVSASDECTPTGSLTLTQTPAAGTLLGAGTHTVTVTATDGGGNSTSCDVPLMIVDRRAPALVGLPDDQTVDCSGIPGPPTVTGVDNCDGDVAVSYQQIELDGDCPESVRVIQRIWSTTDSSGNAVSESRTITVVDTAPPELTVPADVMIECGTSIDPSATGFASAVDDCDATPTITFSDQRAAGACGGAATISRTWTAADECGNQIAGVQIITTIDEMPPVLGVSPAVAGSPNYLWHSGGHDGAILTAAFTADGSHVITGGPEGTVRIWRTADSVLERILYGHAGSVVGVALSPDQQTIYSSSTDQKIRIWRYSDGAPLATISTGSPIRKMVVTPDGLLAVAHHYDGNTYTGFTGVWRLADGVLVRTLAQSGGEGLAVSPDGLYVAARGNWPQINLWRLSDGAIVRTFTQNLTIHALEFSPDSTILGVATGYLSQGPPNIHLYSVADGTLLREFETVQGVSSLAFAPDGLSLAAGFDRRIRTYRVADGSVIRDLWRPDWRGLDDMLAPVTLEYSPDGTQLLSGSGSHHAYLNNSPEDDSLDLWDVSSGTHIRGITQHRRSVNSVVYNAARNILVTGSSDWTVRTFDASNGSPLRTISGLPGPVVSVCISTDGALLASACGSFEPRIRFWDAMTGAQVGTIENPHPNEYGPGGAGSIALSPDGSLLVSAGYGGRVKFWRVSDGALLREMVYDGIAFAFSPDGQVLAIASSNSFGKARLTRVSDGAILHELDTGCALNTIAFSPRGDLVAVGDGRGAWCGNSVHVFRVSDGARLYSRPADGGAVSAIAFSPSGDYFASGNSMLSIWRVADGSRANHFTNVGQWVTAIAYTTDDNHFAFGRSDAAVSLATPTPSGATPGDVTVACGAAVPPPPALVAADNCDLNPTVTFAETSSIVGGDVEYTLTRTWNATDACGNSTSHTQVVTVLSCNQPPAAVCPGDITVEANGAAGTLVQLDGRGSFDPDQGDVLSYHWDVSDVSLDNPDSAMPSGVFPNGITRATLTVTDGHGGVDTCDVLVTVRDTTPPQVMCTSDLAMLWPPNHDMRTVRLYIAGTDAVSDPRDFVLQSVTLRSDEPDDAAGNGDGATTGDVDGADGYAAPVNITARFTFDASIGERGAWVATVQLRAERAGSGDGRCYTIDVAARDSSGNPATTSCCIVVPHDRRR